MLVALSIINATYETLTMATFDVAMILVMDVICHLPANKVIPMFFQKKIQH